MKTVAYLLTSFDSAEIRKQKQAILEFAVSEQLTISRFIEIPISSPLPTKGRKLNRLLSHVESGDRLIVSRLSQIGGSLSEIVKTVDMLIKKEVRFVAVEEGIDLNGKPSTQSQVIAAMFGMLAEIGHQLVSRHTQEALDVAKRRGRVGGRRPALSPQQQDLAMKCYQQAEHSVKEICQMLGISKTTLYSDIKKANVTLRRDNISQM